MSNSLLPLLVCSCLMFKGIQAQDTSVLTRLGNIPGKFFQTVNSRANNFSDRLKRETQKYLERLEREEKKLQRKLHRKDPAAAEQLFGNVEEKYQKIRSAAESDHSEAYSGHLDSISTAIRFLKQYNISQHPDLPQSLSALNDVQESLNVTASIRKQLLQRQRILHEQLQKLGMAKELRKFKQELYYYQVRIHEFRSYWEDPSKLESKLSELIQQLPEFKEFFAKNSQLGALFAQPGSSSLPGGSLAGLQTRAIVQQGLTERFGASSDVMQMVQQNVQSAQNDLTLLRTRGLNSSGSFGNGSDGINIPEGFRPNNQKTKTFLQRIELGTNFQAQRARYYFPAIADVGLSAGYKLNDKSTLGIGLSYKAGLGSGWDHIALTHQGVGLRSFIDFKLKGSLYITGGYEQNYLSEFNRLSQLRDHSSWQTSALLGLSRKYKAGGKLKGDIRLLWDFMSYQQTPKAQAILFRVGYNFN